MNILIIEDDPNKLRQIVGALRGPHQEHHVSTQVSYRSGLKAALAEQFDLLVLDMTMPTYDASPTEPGGRIRHYAGREILAELLRRKRRAKAVVVTQFENFGVGADAMTLEQLKARLEEEYPEHYLGTVFYSASESGWREQLLAYVERVRSSS